MMKGIKQQLMWAVMFCFVFIVACGPTAEIDEWAGVEIPAVELIPVDETADAPTPTSESQYPIPVYNEVENSGYPVVSRKYYPMIMNSKDNIDPSVPVLDTTPSDAGLGTIVGIVQSAETGTAYIGIPLMLGEVLEDGDTIVLDLGTSPYTQSDADGNFRFRNIEPGNYVLVIGNPEVGNDYTVRDAPNVAKVYDVIADTTTDAGTVVAVGLREYRTK